MNSGIYTITNLINGKIYVGLAKNLKRRLDNHKYNLLKNTHFNEYLQKSFNKYGENNFVFEVLEIYPVDLLCAMEHYWCTILNTHNEKYGYNISPTNPNNLHPKHNFITLNKMSKTKNKEVHMFDMNGNYLESFKNAEFAKNYLNVKCKDRINACCNNKAFSSYGYRFSYKRDGELLPINNRYKYHKKIVYQYDKQINFIKKWDSVADAAKHYNTLDNNIMSVCKNKTKTAKNYIWSYTKLK